ncbi:MAG: hypothetical protein ACK559_37850, partial [bacterium]
PRVDGGGPEGQPREGIGLVVEEGALGDDVAPAGGGEAQPRRVQAEPRDAAVLAPPAVDPRVAVRGVAHERMPEVPAVAAHLVEAAGARPDPQQGAPRLVGRAQHRDVRARLLERAERVLHRGLDAAHALPPRRPAHKGEVLLLADGQRGRERPRERGIGGE